LLSIHYCVNVDTGFIHNCCNYHNVADWLFLLLPCRCHNWV